LYQVGSYQDKSYLNLANLYAATYDKQGNTHVKWRVAFALLCGCHYSHMPIMLHPDQRNTAISTSLTARLLVSI